MNAILKWWRTVGPSSDPWMHRSAEDHLLGNFLALPDCNSNCGRHRDRSRPLEVSTTGVGAWRARGSDLGPVLSPYCRRRPNLKNSGRG